MALDYTTYVATMANLTVNDPTDDNYLQILPSMIAYAENRSYRDLDLLSTIVVDNSTTLNDNTRDFTIPIPAAGAYEVVTNLNLLENGSRTPLTPVTRDILDFIWPSTTAADSTTRPQVFTVTNATTISVGPVSGTSITVEILGRVNPIPLSASNTTTYLTNFFWDLFIAASMVFASGWQKNFGSQSDDPRMSASWEAQYQALLQNADQYSARQKFAAASWSPQRTEPFASAQRG